MLDENETVVSFSGHQSVHCYRDTWFGHLVWTLRLDTWCGGGGWATFIIRLAVHVLLIKEKIAGEMQR